MNARGRYAHVGGPPAEVSAHVRSAVAATRASTLSTRRRVMTALISIAALTVMIVWIASEAVYHRPAAGLDLAVVSTPRAVAGLGLLIVLTSVVTANALRRGGAGLGPDVLSLAVIAAAAAPLYAVVATVLRVHASAADGLIVAGISISPWGSRCASIATLIGGLTLVALTFALRRALAAAGPAHGAAVGATAGVWAGLGVFAFCPSGSVPHILAGHVSIVLLLTIAGALFMSRWLRP